MRDRDARACMSHIHVMHARVNGWKCRFMEFPWENLRLEVSIFMKFYEKNNEISWSFLGSSGGSIVNFIINPLQILCFLTKFSWSFLGSSGGSIVKFCVFNEIFKKVQVRFRQKSPVTRSAVVI